MKCTSCKQGHLVPNYLDTMLPAHTCDHCGGSLLKLYDFFRWRSEGGADHLSSEGEIRVAAEETPQAMLCPKSGKLMTKYRIAANSEHKLDFSSEINAVWLDRGEWDLLKANGLATQLSSIFTEHWQHEIRDQESREIMEQLYTKKFGKDYAYLMEVRAFLDGLESRHEALAFLMSDDPFEA